MNNMKRMRGRNNRGGQGGGGGGGPPRHHASGGGVPLNRNHVFDSSGPDLRIRGTAQQLFEKYLQLGRDASGAGDRVMAESYFQHAEHYFRILNAMAQVQQQGPPQQGQQGGGYNGGQHQRRPYGENSDSEPDQEGGPMVNGLANGMTNGGGGMNGEQPMLDSRDIPITHTPTDG